jgi:aspartyl-tRNA(Asn)/glutamyl-tRNA(Gln) amidotransferase subunit A
VLEETEGYTAPRYATTLQERDRLEADVAALFDDVEVLLTPTTAVAAFAAEGPPPREIDGRPVEPAMSTPFTMLGNLCWNPSISVPAGHTADGLPVGLMLTVRRHRDDLALRLARIFEQERPWPLRAPAR